MLQEMNKFGEFSMRRTKMGLSVSEFLSENDADLDRMTIKEMQFLFKSSCHRSSRQGNPVRVKETLEKSLEEKRTANFVSQKGNAAVDDDVRKIPEVLKCKFPKEECGASVMDSKKSKIENGLAINGEDDDGLEDDWTLNMWQSLNNSKQTSHVRKLKIDFVKEDPSSSDQSDSHEDVKRDKKQSNDEEEEDDDTSNSRNKHDGQARKFPFCGTFVLKPKVRLVLEGDNTTNEQKLPLVSSDTTKSGTPIVVPELSSTALTNSQCNIPRIEHGSSQNKGELSSTALTNSQCNIPRIEHGSSQNKGKSELKEGCNYQMRLESSLSVPRNVDNDVNVKAKNNTALTDSQSKIRSIEHGSSHNKGKSELKEGCNYQMRLESSISVPRNVDNDMNVKARNPPQPEDVYLSNCKNVGRTQENSDALIENLDRQGVEDKHGDEVAEGEEAVLQRPTTLPCKRKAISPLSREKLIQATNSPESLEKTLSHQQKTSDSPVARGRPYFKGSSHELLQSLRWRGLISNQNNGDTKRASMDLKVDTSPKGSPARNNVNTNTATSTNTNTKNNKRKLPMSPPPSSSQRCHISTGLEVDSPRWRIPQRLSLELGKSPSPPPMQLSLEFNNSPSPQPSRVSNNSFLQPTASSSKSPTLPSKSILRSGSQACQRGACQCPECASVRNRAMKASEFSQRQMKDIEALAVKLTNELNSMKTLVEDKLLLHIGSQNPDAEEVKMAVKKATETLDMSKKWLIRMARDCNRYCKVTRLQQRKIAFADESGGQLCEVKVFDSQSNSNAVDEKGSDSVCKLRTLQLSDIE